MSTTTPTPRSQTPAQRCRILGATLTALADRIDAGEDKSLSIAMLNYVLAEVRATKQAIKNG